MKTYTQFLNEDTSGGFYSFRNLNPQSAEFLYEWMLEEGIPNPIPAHNLHVTIVCSETDVPGYMPDPTPVMISPASYKIEQMQEALVIKFRNDTLEEQWQRAMNMGAKSRYPRFIPHVSMSYKVPESYDPSDLKPPPSFLILDGEQQRPLVDGWAAMNNLREYTGDIISDVPNIYVPQNHLDVPREHMPQIRDAEKMGFVDWLEEKGVLVQYVDVPVAILRSVQNEIDLKKVERLMANPTNKAIIISKDGFVLDGHHRWVAALNHDPHQMLPAYRINLSVQQCLSLISDWQETR